MTYESRMLFQLEHANDMYQLGVTGGKRLALSLLEVKLLEAGIVPTGDMQEVIETLRKEFNSDLENDNE